MNETLSKYLAIGILLGLIAGFVAFTLTNQALFIEAGAIVGILVGAAVGSIMAKKK